MEFLDINKICRLCLSERNPGEFSLNEEFADIQKKFEILTNSQVELTFLRFDLTLS